MKYEEVDAVNTTCTTLNCKRSKKMQKYPKFFRIIFSYAFAILLFANLISLTCILSTEFKGSVVGAFYSFDLDKIKNGDDKYLYNLIVGESQFKNTIELDLPVLANYTILSVGIVFDIVDEIVLQSNVDGQVVNVSGEDKKSISIKFKDDCILHFLNLNACVVKAGDNVARGTNLGSVKGDTKLYFYITKNDERLNLKILSGKVVIVEE